MDHLRSCQERRWHALEVHSSFQQVYFQFFRGRAEPRLHHTSFTPDVEQVYI
jgi:hypothetical protein